MATLNNYDEGDETVMPCLKGRKRKVNTALHEINIIKAARHSGGGKIPTIACKHNEESFCKAATLSNEQVTNLFQSFYSSAKKVTQDSILLSYMTICQVIRRRLKTDNNNKQRDVSIKYHVLDESKTRLPICKASFMSIFCK
jgi:hypothetical protein